MRAIETRYNGYRFRSRLEARWAVFFDELGIRYEYEPEGFVLKSGKRYLPDFYLPDFTPGCYFDHYNGLFIEVKGRSLTKEEYATISEFGSVKTPIAILEGSVPFEEVASFGLGADRYEIYTDVWDGGYYFCECEYCGLIGFEFCGLAERLPCRHFGRMHQKKYGHATDRIMNAYAAARSARFEHGEMP